jgi:hypothetical protein
VGLGLGDHRLEQASVVLLDLAAPAKLGLRLAHPDGQGISYALQLGDAQHPRSTDRADRPVHPPAGKRGGKQLAEALLQQRYLATQVIADAALREEVDALPAVAEDRVHSLRRLKRFLARLDLQQLLGHQPLSFRPDSTFAGRFYPRLER